MRRDTLATAAITTAAAMVALLTAGGGAAAAAARILAGLPLILILPGYALGPLVLPAGSGRPPQIGPLLWRAMWVPGLSLAVTVFCGLVLNLLPVGLTRVSWTVSLSAVTLLSLVASTWLPGSRPAPAAVISRARPGMRIAAGYAVAALAISGAALGLAIASAGWQHSQGFAQLWLVPARGTAVDSGTASLGVRSGYSGAETFHLVLRGDTNAVLSWDFALKPGQAWQRTIGAPAGQHLTAQLTVTGGRSAAEMVAING